MGKIIVFENISVDGYIAGPKGELDWAIHDDEVTQSSKEGEGKLGMFMFGRVTYDMMAKVWPTPMGKAANPVFAEVLNNNPKAVFSRTLTKADWDKTEIIKELTNDSVNTIKQRVDGNIMIFGSGTIVNQLTTLRLVDEYQLMVNPVILGAGKPLFDVEPTKLKLLKTKVFKNGIVRLHYSLAK